MCWEPFVLAAPDQKVPFPKPMSHTEGLGDRLRIAAFAELQAVRAFGWAAEHFRDVSMEVINGWERQIPEEKLHFRLIMERMNNLGIQPHQKPVSAQLSETLYQCQTGKAFAIEIATAEHRGRLAALKMAAYLENRDPVTARVFLRIARDEVAHVQLVIDHFGWTPGPSPADL
ncbi:MAG: ferritin-like domain-containing protein [Deltaproteobacteria bacterium]|nr:ferritin-like domain-containing protein [Deltaproteobacteria bacterium]